MHVQKSNHRQPFAGTADRFISNADHLAMSLSQSCDSVVFGVSYQIVRCRGKRSPLGWV